MLEPTLKPLFFMMVMDYNCFDYSSKKKKKKINKRSVFFWCIHFPLTSLVYFCFTYFIPYTSKNTLTTHRAQKVTIKCEAAAQRFEIDSIQPTLWRRLVKANKQARMWLLLISPFNVHVCRWQWKNPGWGVVLLLWICHQQFMSVKVLKMHLLKFDNMVESVTWY